MPTHSPGIVQENALGEDNDAASMQLPVNERIDLQALTVRREVISTKAKARRCVLDNV